MPSLLALLAADAGLKSAADLFTPLAKTNKAPASKQPPKQATKPLPASQNPPTYWAPQTIVLRISSWKCDCGNCGESTPQVFIRESHNKISRLRAIDRDLQYPNLSREVQTDEPAHLHICPACFKESLQAQQPELPGIPEVQPPVYKLSPLEKVWSAYEQLRAVNEGAHHKGVNVSFDMTYYALAQQAEWIIQHPAIAFREKPELNGMQSHYKVNVITSDVGPTLPHCLCTISPLESKNV